MADGGPQLSPLQLQLSPPVVSLTQPDYAGLPMVPQAQPCVSLSSSNSLVMQGAVPALKWSYFKPEYSGKPDENEEGHLLRTSACDGHPFTARRC